MSLINFQLIVNDTFLKLVKDAKGVSSIPKAKLKKSSKIIDYLKNGSLKLTQTFEGTDDKSLENFYVATFEEQLIPEISPLFENLLFFDGFYQKSSDDIPL